jgi:hypothetical protein
VSAPAPALGGPRRGRQRRTCTSGNGRASSRDVPYDPRHEAAVTAFHSSPDEPVGRSRPAGPAVAAVLCTWCGNSRAKPSLCRCRW